MSSMIMKFWTISYYNGTETYYDLKLAEERFEKVCEDSWCGHAILAEHTTLKVFRREDNAVERH